MKNIIILRSVSNSGKSSLAELLCFNRVGWVSCEADTFFVDKEGNYNFDATKLGAAHNWCQNKFIEYLNEQSISTVVVANTACNPRDMKFYEDEANKRGYRITYLVLERRHNNTNSHGVPENVLEMQEQKLKNSLKLR